MTLYSKFIIAAAAALGVAVSISADGEFSLNDGFSIASAAVGALLVYVIPNKPKEG